MRLSPSRTVSRGREGSSWTPIEPHAQRSDDNVSGTSCSPASEIAVIGALPGAMSGRLFLTTTGFCCRAARDRLQTQYQNEAAPMGASHHGLVDRVASTDGGLVPGSSTEYDSSCRMPSTFCRYSGIASRETESSSVRRSSVK